MLLIMKIKTTILILILFIVSCPSSKKEGVEKPNVIFIMLDDFGYSQIACNSEEISEKDYDPLFLQYTLENGDYSPEQALEFSRKATPTLSRMAKEGVMFTNAFAPSNLCSPSRLAIATGIQPNHWGIYRNIDSEAHGPEPGSLLVEKLHDAGYTTAHIGKWHIGSRDQNMVPEFMKKHGIKDSAGIYPSIYKFPKILKDLKENGYLGSTIKKHHALNNGFDYYYGYNTWESPFYNATNVWNGFEFAGKSPKYNTDVFTDLAIDFIDKRVEKEQPFYIQLHFHAVHAPLHPKAPDQYYNKFDSKSFVLNNFYAHVLAVDENVKRLENYLKEKGLAENTIIVFTSDNGGSIGRRSTMPGNAPFRGHKGMYLMGGIKVPLFFYWPKGIKTPEKNNQLVSALDILPTVLDATGINPVHDYLVWSGIHAHTWGFMKQYNIYPEVPSRDMAPYAWVVVKDGYSLRYVGETRKGHYKDIPEGKSAYYEMYDISADPGERNNLLNTKPKIFQELKAIWEEEAKEFPPPFKIGKEKWEQIIPKDNKYLKN